jgi:hypothetical protein
VAWYRIYFFDRNGHIGRALDIECADDDEAVRRMDEEKHAFPLELWERERRIRRLEPIGGG